jgi:hypothetical protein
MDPKFVGLFAQYMEKTGSLTADVQNILTRTEKYIDKQDTQKTASASLTKTNAERLAQTLSEVRLPSGQPFISGYDQIKQASTMLSDHAKSLEVLNLVLNAVAADNTKRASLEPGRSVNTRSSVTEKDDANSLLRKEVLGR